MPLTAADIKKAEPRDKLYELPDSEGLVLRVTPAGTRSWCVYYWESGRKRRKTVGRLPAVTLKDARQLRDRLKARTGRTGSLTVAAFADEYLERWAYPMKRSAHLDERMLRRDVLPVIGDRPIELLTRRECVEVLNRIQDRGAHNQAARTKALLGRMLKFAVERDIRPDNPAREIVLRQGPPRDRVLDQAELVAWWGELQRAEVPKLVRLALSLQLATGQRLGEVLTIDARPLRDLDLGNAVWTIPAAKAKNGITHTVPLTRWAQSIIEAAMPGAGRRLLPVTADTVREHMRALVARLEMERATPHDLRRTVATWLGSLGYDRNIQDRILNHKDQSVGGIYDRYSYDAEKRAALQAWADAFAAMTEHGTKTAPRTNTENGARGPR